MEGDRTGAAADGPRDGSPVPLPYDGTDAARTDGATDAGDAPGAALEADGATDTANDAGNATDSAADAADSADAVTDADDVADVAPGTDGATGAAPPPAATPPPPEATSPPATGPVAILPPHPPTGPMPPYPVAGPPPDPAATGAFAAPPWPPPGPTAPGWPPPPPWPPPPHAFPGYPGYPGYPGHPETPPPSRRERRAALWGALAGVAVAALVAGLLGVALFDPFATVDTAATQKNDKRLDLSSDPEGRFGEPAVRESADNPLYALDPLPTTDCELPSLDPASDESWETFASDAGACLDEMWSPHLAAVGLDPDPVEYVVESQAPTDEFGDDDLILGYYQNNRITIAVDGVAEVAREVPGGDHEGVWLGLVAHEYGHYVQDHTGILGHSWRLESKADTEAEALELLRRSELQAECLSGAALGATGHYDESDLELINEVLNGGDDSETHGSRNNRQTWLRDGWNMGSMDDCNTYTADVERVR